MSYLADHVAWQQRVFQEYKAQSNSIETSKVLENSGVKWQNYPDLIDYIKSH